MCCMFYYFNYILSSMCAFIHAASVLQRTWNISSISTEQGNDAESMDGGKKHFFLDKKLKNE